MKIYWFWLYIFFLNVDGLSFTLARVWAVSQPSYFTHQTYILKTNPL